MTNPALAKKLRAEATRIRAEAEAAYEAALVQAEQLEASAAVLAGGAAPAPRGKRGTSRKPKVERTARRVSNAPRPTGQKKPRVGKEIQRRLKAGEGIKAIARAVPCAPSTVSYHAKKLKLDPPA